MKKIGIGFLIASLLLLIALGLYLFRGSTINNSPQTSQNQTSLETQSNEAESVTVEAKPEVLEAGKEVVFDLSLNTHSVELDYDIASISILTDDKRNQYQASSWSGNKGGHHISGKLVFPTLKEDAKQITLTVKGIAGKDRVFSWNIR